MTIARQSLCPLNGQVGNTLIGEAIDQQMRDLLDRRPKGTTGA